MFAYPILPSTAHPYNNIILQCIAGAQVFLSREIRHHRILRTENVRHDKSCSPLIVALLFVKKKLILVLSASFPSNLSVYYTLSVCRFVIDWCLSPSYVNIYIYILYNYIQVYLTWHISEVAIILEIVCVLECWWYLLGGPTYLFLALTTKYINTNS